MENVITRIMLPQCAQEGDPCPRGCGGYLHLVEGPSYTVLLVCDLNWESRRFHWRYASDGEVQVYFAREQAALMAA